MFNALTTFENIKIGVEAGQKTGPIGAMLHLPRTRREERESDHRTLDLLELVGLTHRLNTMADSLPYGDRRRLEIARALGTNPEVLLLDEPAAGTNPSEKLGLAELIRKINKETGISILLIEHDMKLVMSLAERLYVLNFGQVIASGPPAEIQQNHEVIAAYLGTTEADDDAS
jgi:branched-chain amino acid transport system ATP-binding protein